MNDYIVRATAAGETVRAFAIKSTGLTAEARELHHTFPVVTAALGRLLSAAAMMGSMMKGENDKLTLQMKGDGPIAQMTVTADSHGNGWHSHQLWRLDTHDLRSGRTGPAVIPLQRPVAWTVHRPGDEGRGCLCPV